MSFYGMEVEISKRESSRREGTAPGSSGRLPFRLTRREQDLLDLLMKGYANKAIAARLGVSGSTVKNQLSVLYKKAGVSTRVELVMLAQRRGGSRYMR
jgi:DNA-binding NarL/FixJ family response regulator